MKCNWPGKLSRDSAQGFLFACLLEAGRVGTFCPAYTQIPDYRGKEVQHKAHYLYEQFKHSEPLLVLSVEILLKSSY